MLENGSYVEEWQKLTWATYVCTVILSTLDLSLKTIYEVGTILLLFRRENRCTEKQRVTCPTPDNWKAGNTKWKSSIPYPLLFPSSTLSAEVNANFHVHSAPQFMNLFHSNISTQTCIESTTLTQIFIFIYYVLAGPNSKYKQYEVPALLVFILLIGGGQQMNK